MNELADLDAKNLCFIINNYKKSIDDVINDNFINYGVHEMNVINELE